MNQASRWLWRVSGKKKGYIAVLTLIQAIASSLSVVYALVLRSVVDSAVRRDSIAFRQNVLGILGLFLAQIAIFAVIRWLNELAKSDIENNLKRRLAGSILHKDYASVCAMHTAQWLNRLTSDTSVVAGGMVEILPGLVGMAVRLISAMIIIIALDPWFASILIPGGLLLILVTYFFRKILKRLHKNIQESDGRLRVFLQERLGSLMVIKAFAAEDQTLRQASAKMEAHKHARMKRNHMSNIANIGFGSAMRGMYLLGIVYCAHGILTGTVTYGTLTAIMHLIGQIQTPFANISGYLPRWYATTASAERLMEVEAQKDDLQVLPAPVIHSFYQKEFSSISFQDACFAYPPAEDEAPLFVLRNLNLEIRKGEYIAFTGHSGCGKSTVLKLLMCMYPLNSGQLLLNDKELTAAWRRLFAYVPQGNALMTGTIREIVSFADPEAGTDDARLKRALTIACADEFVENADAVLGERGAGLSEGQMQRIAIARAIFADSPILLLDEATSALDEETEKQLLENLQRLTDKTVLIVTHRTAALSICDRVIRFSDAGAEIIEDRNLSLDSTASAMA